MRILIAICLFSLAVQSSQSQIGVKPGDYVCPGDTVWLISRVDTLPAATDSYAVSAITYAPEAYLGTSIGSLSDDDANGPFAIGFDFCFFGQYYDSFWVASNGWISFSQPTPAMEADWSPESIPSIAGSVPKNAVMGPWEDYDPSIGGSILYRTIGSAPNRKLVVTWDHVPMFTCTGDTGAFQIVLHEGTQVIENHIKQKSTCTSWAFGYAVQGIHNSTGTEGFAFPGRNATSWTTTNHSVRFAPAGTKGTTIDWFNGAGTLIGTGDSIGFPISSDDTFTMKISGAICADSLEFTKIIKVLNPTVDAGADSVACLFDSVLLSPTITGSAIPPPAICGAGNNVPGGSPDSMVVGTSTAGTVTPTIYNQFVRDQKVQMLYRATELGGIDSGVITKIAFNITNKLTSRSFTDFTISIGCTDSQTLEVSSGWINTVQTVYGPYVETTALGWNVYELDAPYTWDGKSNLVVEVCFDNSATGFYDLNQYTNKSFNCVLQRGSTSSTADGCTFTTPSTAYRARPNIRIVREDFGPTDFTYCWSPGAMLSDSTARSPKVYVTGPGYYKLTIKGGPCVKYDSVFIDTVGCGLPVELLHFTAQKDGNASKINWTTITEVNSHYFEVHRSIDGRSFSKIGTLMAAGNSSQLLDYELYDNNPHLGLNYYRLKQVDLDGSYEWSEVRTVDFSNGDKVIRVYPNPSSAGQGFTLAWDGKEHTEDIIVELFNDLGQLVYSQDWKVEDQKDPLNIHQAKELATGLYFIILRDENELLGSFKMQIQ